MDLRNVKNVPNFVVAMPARLIFPDECDAKARKVVLRSNHGHVYKFPSSKCKRIVELESGLELDRATQLETNSDVVAFSEQPFMIEYADEGKNKVIFPDFVVLRRDGSRTVEEVKPAGKAGLPEFRRRCAIEEAVLALHGYKFSLLTEHDIQAEPQLTNVKMLLPYRRFYISTLLRISVRELLSKQTNTGHNLVERVAGLTEAALFAMVAQGYLDADLSYPLDMGSLYRVS